MCILLNSSFVVVGFITTQARKSGCVFKYFNYLFTWLGRWQSTTSFFTVPFKGRKFVLWNRMEIFPFVLNLLYRVDLLTHCVDVSGYLLLCDTISQLWLYYFNILTNTLCNYSDFIHRKILFPPFSPPFLLLFQFFHALNETLFCAKFSKNESNFFSFSQIQD